MIWGDPMGFMLQFCVIVKLQSILMKTKIGTLLLGILLCATASGQIKGSGKIVFKNYDFKNFDKIDFKDLNANIEVAIGKPWSVKIDIDDNLTDLLEFQNDAKSHTLKISFSGNRNNRLYIENTNIKIRITMPEASVITQQGNSDLSIVNVMGRYFRIENTSNGNARVSGQVDSLEVIHSGNGNVDAQKLKAKNATITSTGNGDVLVSASDGITASGSGNGDVINAGKAAFSKNATRSGNGKLIARNLNP